MKAIVDCNSFYCSCERLFRPDLRNKPVVVLSNNDGCIVSRSDEAKQLGVQMAGPYFLARPIIQQHNIAVFSSNYNLYGDLSWRVMETLRTLSPTVEVYSVDEAFLDFSHIPENELEEAALRVRERVEQWTGISVSVGVAPTKTLAKLANYHAKKNKALSNCIKVLAKDRHIAEALQATRVSNVWGVGRAFANKLINQGITSAWELSNMPEEWAHRHMGGVTGVRLLRELKGSPSIDLDDPLTTKKMIATTRMFGEPVGDIASIREAVATYTTRAAEKLRRQHSAAGIVSVFIVSKEQDHLTDFHHGPTHSTHITLPVPISVTQELIKPAVALVDRLFKNGKEYKKAGVMLSGLVPDQSIQGNLFAAPEKKNHRELMDIVDNVNFSMRNDMLKFAAVGTTRNWKMRQELHSARFTTRWDELIEVS
ncbi:Y-family DNA polymerase [Paraflavitalea sp. CAU 1676]|uniref:Y-family DNA polymerase n=1 Tax=Paraflavitalea sp. CAU 1676 TaxID=3032598 RepID=UPI0023D9B474|nr:Y-family DNA polymerase [Paraflavitalea sp. CAU 1676]MDF2187033.1 Y-family DNA polymerase [Paraflavitalea sp. CAU 1676]